MLLSPGMEALVDQWAAAIRDFLDACDVDVDDPAQRKAMNAMWLMAAMYANDRESLLFMLHATGKLF